MDPATRRRSFFLPFEAIRPLAPGRGLSFATDRITVDGYPVGYMYRERPDCPNDSGWRFMAGDEPREYLDDPAIPFLDVPIGSAYERHPERGCFRSVSFPEEADESE